jgi:hypothetical protein
LLQDIQIGLGFHTLCRHTQATLLGGRYPALNLRRLLTISRLAMLKAPIRLQL